MTRRVFYSQLSVCEERSMVTYKKLYDTSNEQLLKNL